MAKEKTVMMRVENKSEREQSQTMLVEQIL